MLSWQLPDTANQPDVDLDFYSINYTRIGSRMYMTHNSQIPTVVIGGVNLNQTYLFRVSANYSHPVLQSAEETLTLRTESELSVLRVS